MCAWNKKELRLQTSYFLSASCFFILAASNCGKRFFFLGNTDEFLTGVPKANQLCNCSLLNRMAQPNSGYNLLYQD